jgi:hypothetical protein
MALKANAKTVGFVLLVFWIVLSLVGIFWPLGWSFLFAILAGYLIFDFIFDFFLKGRKIPLSGSHLFQPAGYRFAAFLAGIGIASIVSTLLAQWCADYLAHPNSTNLELTVPASAIVAIFLLVDFRIRDEPPG